MNFLQKFRILALAIGCILLPTAAAATAPVAIFPLQELGEGRNEVNLPFSRELAERLKEIGNDITPLDTVIDFMGNNRIRTVGRLETFHVSKVRDDLGAAFVLLGTVTQRKERPQPAMGLTLNLIRTNDARTIWSYVGNFSSGDERRPLGIGEPDSVGALVPLLLDDIVREWPWDIINEVQQAKPLSIDSMALRPAEVRPGGEVHARVRLRDIRSGRTPRVFFKADDQLYAATASADGRTFEGTWVAGEKNGRIPVTLVLEMPLYGRTESALIGTYVVDGTAPLFEIDLRGARMQDGIPTFRDALIIVPRHLLRKPLDRWRLSFYGEGDRVGFLEQSGNMPERFLWRGQGGSGSLDDGIYQVVLEAWDKAGNAGKAAREVMLSRRQPKIGMALIRRDDQMIVDLKDKAKVPLAYWRMEMWTKEGKLLTEAEGNELPAQIGFDLAAADQDQELLGFVFVEDALGNRIRSKVGDLLPKIEPKKPEEQKDKGISKDWVDEF